MKASLLLDTLRLPLTSNVKFEAMLGHGTDCASV